MKCLSVMQPWAWLLATGRKTVEFRTWKHRHRGPILIAASMKHDRGGDAYLRRASIALPPPASPHFLYGKIIATATLDDVVRFTPAMVQHALCEYAEGYGFCLSGVKMLDRPVPVKGKLGLYEVPWP